jgi:hypothetical protein
METYLHNFLNGMERFICFFKLGLHHIYKFVFSIFYPNVYVENIAKALNLTHLPNKDVIEMVYNDPLLRKKLNLSLEDIYYVLW